MRVRSIIFFLFLSTSIKAQVPDYHAETLDLNQTLMDINTPGAKAATAYGNLKSYLQLNPDAVLPDSFYAPLKRDFLTEDYSVVSRTDGCFRFRKLPDDEIRFFVKQLLTPISFENYIASSRYHIAFYIVKALERDQKEQFFIELFSKAPSDLNLSSILTVFSPPYGPRLRTGLVQFLRANQNDLSPKFLSTESFVLSEMPEEVEDYLTLVLQNQNVSPAAYSYLFRNMYPHLFRDSASFLRRNISNLFPDAVNRKNDILEITRVAVENSESALSAIYFDEAFDYILSSTHDLESRKAVASATAMYIQWMGSEIVNGLNLPVSREKKLRLLREFWPLILNEETFQTGYSLSYALRNITDPEYLEEIDFLTRSLNPAFQAPESKDLVTAFINSLKRTKGSMINFNDADFTADTLITFYFSQQSRNAGLARDIIRLRLSEESFDQVLKRLESTKNEFEMNDLICSRSSLSSYSRTYLTRKFQEPRFISGIKFYLAAPRWKNAENFLIPLLLSHRDQVEAANQARLDLISLLLSQPSGAAAYLKLSDKDKADALQSLASTATYSGEIVQGLLNFLPSDVKHEDLVGAALYYFSKVMPKLSDEEIAALKPKLDKALDIHVGPRVDENFLFLLNALKNRKPEWSQEIDSQILEVRKGMGLSK